MRRLAEDHRFPVTVCCRVLGVSRSGYYDWRDRPASQRERHDAWLTELITEFHRESNGTAGAPMIHADLRIGLGIPCGRKRVARLMRTAGLSGACHHRKRRHKPAPATCEDRVQRDFTAAGPDRIWCTDITEHPTSEGKLYCCAVLDVFSRKIVGWSIAEHARSELVVDALTMARWRRQPEATIVHSDRGPQYTSWVFGHQLRSAGLLGSMGRVASSVDNAMMESFFATLQREVLDRQHWNSRDQLGSAIFTWIETWYNPRRRHSSLDYLSPHDYEWLHEQQQAGNPAETAA